MTDLVELCNTAMTLLILGSYKINEGSLYSRLPAALALLRHHCTNLTPSSVGDWRLQITHQTTPQVDTYMRVIAYTHNSWLPAIVFSSILIDDPTLPVSFPTSNSDRRHLSELAVLRRAQGAGWGIAQSSRRSGLGISYLHQPEVSQLNSLKLS